ncbi:hypothetical protein [Streptomonospora litoralis]|uniref:Uncharacterized protein n=1 Tax=Streptomonospora litoralis TaxID=2498135 RepID=A0A4P6Q8P4_9ACTN|nr:hypothetical protein [Streptomonospora litoralis]QBI56860.1 hypothetical protein EKD16_25600 [Streptomonospora litoralis]
MAELPPSPIEVVGPDDYAYAILVDHQGKASVYGTADARTAAQWLTALAIDEWRKVDGPGNSVEKLAQFLRDHG